MMCIVTLKNGHISVISRMAIHTPTSSGYKEYSLYKRGFSALHVCIFCEFTYPVQVSLVKKFWICLAVHYHYAACFKKRFQN
jgi:hypothetical protein